MTALASCRSSSDGKLSLLQEDDGPRLCDWCLRQLPETARPECRFCCQRHRQAAWRIRRQHQVRTRNRKPICCAYMDPPYPGFARRLYRAHHDYAGEVDHAAMIRWAHDRYDGWALSTGAYALRDVLPLCPPNTLVCAWVKPIGVSSRTRGPHNAWEPLLVVPGRRLQPGKRDWLRAQPARGEGDLMGRKPLAFAAWLFELLGLQPGDQLDDLFPGSGIITRAWAELSRGSVADAGLGDGRRVAHA